MSSQSLQAEIRKLRSELAQLREKQAPIQIDPAEGRITIENYQTDQFTINHMTAHSDAMKDMASSLAQVEKWVKPLGGGRRQSLPDLNRGLKEKIEVDSLKMTVPFDAINKMIPKVAGPQLKQAGVKDIRVSKGKAPNEVSVSGRAKKFVFETDFSATGKLSVSKSGKPIFSLNQTKVAGFAVPNLLASVATAVLAGSKMKEFGISQFGDDFAIDPSKMLPANIKSNLTTIRLAEDGFVIEGGSRPESNQA